MLKFATLEIKREWTVRIPNSYKLSQDADIFCWGTNAVHFPKMLDPLIKFMDSRKDRRYLSPFHRGSNSIF
jgi:hypothetical protein